MNELILLLRWLSWVSLGANWETRWTGVFKPVMLLPYSVTSKQYYRHREH